MIRAQQLYENDYERKICKEARNGDQGEVQSGFG